MECKVQIGIIGAMKVEIEGINEMMENKETLTLSGISFVRGDLFGKKIVTAVCGIGKVFAAMCAQTMILGFSPEIIINSGVAGSLCEELSIGDVVIGEKLVQHDIDTTALGDEKGLISGINKVYIETDEKISAVLKKCVESMGINSHSGTIASGDSFINDCEKKKELAQTFGAVACEMEGGAMAQVCYINKIPFSVMRAISDGGDDNSHLDYNEFLKMASLRSVEVMKKFVEIYE
ncbi:MAG: 5'-methylthioadenosine/adenosylhomocysteine nucleosidase [Acutalibacteraceae bacterium]|nr:5'-methylthioadenosine/adenosylhomocysteine nucleosidase [Clostridia bacterium]MEE3449716.1 5'-methylthioadenosine/adenosylhomocysteine nucleosidase [Acutalibacteraceae bacterium]